MSTAVANPSMLADKGGSSPAAKTSDLFPKGIPFIVGNEGAERFSFYGMKAILYVYLTSLFIQFQNHAAVAPAQLAEAKARATQVNHLFIAGVYAFPMIGAILADRLMGKFNVIFWLSLLYTAGHGVLAVAGRLATGGSYNSAQQAMFLGLALIAMGSGGIKPCVSANVGDQFSKENAHLVTRVYQIFYFIINFGSFFSTIITPILYDHPSFGPEWAFGVPGILMAVATLVFWLGRDKFTKIPPNPGGQIGFLDFVASALLFTPIVAVIVAFFAGHGGGGGVTAYLPHIAVSLLGVILGIVVANVRSSKQQDSGFLAVFLYSLRHRAERKPGMGFFEVARAKFGDEAAEGPMAVLRIMLVFSMVSVFWALFDQHSSTWIEQASRMNLELTVPKYLGMFGLYGTIALAVLGGTWLILWVSNVTLPRTVLWGVVGVVAMAGLAALVADFSNRQMTSLTLKPSQLAALNPLMVMAIIPMLNVLLYGPLEKRGIVIRPLQKMTAGMFLAAGAFAVAALMQVRIEALAPSGDKVHALWQALQYFTMTVAEVLVSVTGLEFAYTQAPRKMKSTIMGFWLLCVTFGNMLVAFLAPLQSSFSLSQFFWLFTGLMAGAAAVFMLMAYFYKGKTYLQEAGH